MTLFIFLMLALFDRASGQEILKPNGIECSILLITNDLSSLNPGFRHTSEPIIDNQQKIMWKKFAWSFDGKKSNSFALVSNNKEPYGSKDFITISAARGEVQSATITVFVYLIHPEGNGALEKVELAKSVMKNKLSHTMNLPIKSDLEGRTVAHYAVVVTPSEGSLKSVGDIQIELSKI